LSISNRTIEPEHPNVTSHRPFGPGCDAERGEGTVDRSFRKSLDTCAVCEAQLADSVLDSAAVRPDAAAFRLTARQSEVLALLCQGLSNKTISRRLAISASTVKVHVGAIFRELRVHNRLQAVLAARQLGLWCDDASAHGERAETPRMLDMMLRAEGT